MSEDVELFKFFNGGVPSGEISFTAYPVYAAYSVHYYFNHFFLDEADSGFAICRSC
ncbi:hypothetical protein KR50_15720 [Jeotgalibacillus campisalis]|uniref:Uncharacterized protein n=1 Tax=Jeotgalibacillus campisalis TaxID=220754 RepID=A0A0C2RAR5_9BACL|nr:hypothetical protein KR50_15720 [Jeotgalibacillus campisalis]